VVSIALLLEWNGLEDGGTGGSGGLANKEDEDAEVVEDGAILAILAAEEVE
jgi:hypothetical protein